MSRKIPQQRHAARSEQHADPLMDEKTKKLRKYFQDAIATAKRHQKRVLDVLGEPPVKTLYKNPFFKQDTGSIENFVFFEKANEKPVHRPKKPTPKRDPTTTATYHCQYKGCGKILPLVPIGNRCKICNLEFCSIHRNPNYHEYKCGDILRGMLLIRAKSIQKLIVNKQKKDYEREIRPMGSEFRRRMDENSKYLKFGESRRKHT